MKCDECPAAWAERDIMTACGVEHGEYGCYIQDKEYGGEGDRMSLISKQVKELRTEADNWENGEWFYRKISLIKMLRKAADTIEMLSKKCRGEWIECHGWERSSSGAYKCSVCGRYIHVKARHPLDWNDNFCSYCGADMRPEEVKE